MSDIVQITDFASGKYYIPTGCYETANLQQFIDETESEYLDKLLGCSLATLLIADLVNGEPTNPEYQAWFNKFCYTPECCGNGCYMSHCCVTPEIQSQGVKVMLMGYVYYGYVRDLQINKTITGMNDANNENSTITDLGNLQINTDNRRNISARTFNAIKNKIAKNTTCNQCVYEEIQTLFG